jgi:polygalacturonase
MKRASFILMTMLLACLPAMMMADSDVSAEENAQNTPAGWTAVSLPYITTITSANTVTAAVSEGAADNAAAIQDAIDAVPNTGGMVVIPAGTYLCGPIKVKSRLVLHLSAGTTLKLLPYGTYPSENEYKDYRGSYKNMYFISGNGTINDLIVEGESQETSVIDGQGTAWWQAYDEYGKFDRPSLIRVQKGSRFLFRNLRLLNSPGTNLTLGQSGNASNFTVHDVTILAPKSGVGGSHNTDGIPIWGPYVNIYDCHISTGDDNVVVDSNGRYVHAWNISCGAGHGMSIGSYTEKVHHIIYEDITFNNTETGFRIKTNNDRSGNDYEGTSSNGSVHDIIFRNSTMTGVRDPVVMTCLYDSDPSDPSKVTPAAISVNTPEYKNILFQNITSTGTPSDKYFKYGNALYIYGRAESYIHDITFDNVQIAAPKGMFMAFCKDIKFINGCDIENTSGGSDFSKRYNATYTGNYKEGKTAVNMIAAEKNSDFSDGSSYNLAGQQVGNDAKGIIVKKGKKYFK